MAHRFAHRRTPQPSSTARGYDATYRRNRLTCLQRDGYHCRLRLDGCAGRADTADHIVSLADGGSNELSNLRAACAPCNAKRGASDGARKRNRARPRPKRPIRPLPL